MITRCSYCREAPAVDPDHIMPTYLRRQYEGWEDVTVPACRQCNVRKYTHTFVPPSWEDRIPELNELTPGHTWRVYRGGPVSDAFRKVHTA